MEVDCLRYAELRNNAGSQIIDDTYRNYRLSYMLPVKLQRCCTGLHVSIDSQGRRICTFPYYDYANGKSYVWGKGELYPNPWCPKNTPNKAEGAYALESPESNLGLREGYVSDLHVGEHIRQRCQPMLKLFSAIFTTRFPISKDHNVPSMVALGAAMPNIIYNLTEDFYGYNTDRPIAFNINLWQRATSLTQQLYDADNSRDITFQGTNVGYTEFEGKIPKNNENFKAETFQEEAETAPVLYAFGLADSKINLDKGEMVIKNERNEVIFNNRFDYMRILDYFPSINALVLNGQNLSNSPKRLSYPGRKIAVVARPQGVFSTYWKKTTPFTLCTYCTGFWFPDPSTVEFTTCVSESFYYHDGRPCVNQQAVDHAALADVMILDVTGCTPGWRYEAETGRPFLEEVK